MKELDSAMETAGARMVERLKVMRGISQNKEWLERTLFSSAADEAAHRLRGWMEAIGMEVTYDALTNVYGLLPLSREGPDAPRIHIGSHYDTVVNAGAYDGTLGVLLAIAVAETIAESKIPFRHNLSALAFCDEEGVRFNTTFLGSAYLSGQFEKEWLYKPDEYGKTLGQWLVDRAESIDELLESKPFIREEDYFLEAHIEQGPVLESTNRALGVFTRIAAQMRMEVELVGCAGHAGTTPARLRKDPLPVACEMVIAVNQICRSDERIRATVGHMEVSPNSSNVIPGRVRFSIDLRHPSASGLEVVAKKLTDQLEAIARRSIVNYNYEVVHQADDVEMDPQLIDCLSASCVKQQENAVRIYSGAGHDSMKIAQVCPVGMLAVRCRGGLSHHPNEYASDEDCLAAFQAMLDTVLTLDQGA